MGTWRLLHKYMFRKKVHKTEKSVEYFYLQTILGMLKIRVKFYWMEVTPYKRESESLILCLPSWVAEVRTGCLKAVDLQLTQNLCFWVLDFLASRTLRDRCGLQATWFIPCCLRSLNKLRYGSKLQKLNTCSSVLLHFNLFHTFSKNLHL